jgi:hypothetical protein
MSWVTLGGPTPAVTGWYATMSRWSADEDYLLGAHWWAGTDWASLGRETIACYYASVFESSHAVLRWISESAR